MLDIGIPRQVSAEAQQLPGIAYSNLDDLIDIQDGGGNQQLALQLEEEITGELELFKRFCIERSIVSVLEDIQRRRQEYFMEQIPVMVSSTFGDLDENTRHLVESEMKRLVSDYSYHSFKSIHAAMEKYWGED